MIDSYLHYSTSFLSVGFGQVVVDWSLSKGTTLERAVDAGLPSTDSITMKTAKRGRANRRVANVATDDAAAI
jgi:hypothetical protein